MKDAEATGVTKAASEKHIIAKLEGELKEAAAQEAETTQRLDRVNRHRSTLDQQLHEAREQATRLRHEEASQSRAALVAEAEEFLQAARVEAEGEADRVTKHASDKADEMIALARRKVMAIVDAGREEVSALEDDAARQMGDLAAENRELPDRLGVMETLNDELVTTLKLVAEIVTKQLVETQGSLEQLDSRETRRVPAEPNNKQTTSASAPQDELLESTGAKADRPIQEAHEEADQSVHGALEEPSEQHNQNGPERDSVHDADDGGGEELAVIIDDRDFAQRHSFYQKWLNLNRMSRDSTENRKRQNKTVSKRLSRIVSSNTVEGADPEEVEARIRNMSHGTNGE